MGWISGQACWDLSGCVLAAVDRGGRVYEIAPLFEVIQVCTVDPNLL